MVDDFQVSDLSEWMEGMLLIKIVKNGGVLWGQEETRILFWTWYI